MGVAQQQSGTGDPYVPPALPIRFLARLYLSVFGRKVFYGWNQLLLTVAARGMCVSDPMLKTIGPGEKTFLNHFSTISNPTVFDVGANIGAYSAELKRLCPSAQIWAFEPHPSTFARLSSQALHLGFHAANIGLSNQSGVMTLFDYAEGSGSPHASLHRAVIEGLHHSETSALEVRVETVDSVLSREGVEHLNLLKIDAEGHEYAILKGASKSIAAGHIDVIQFEFNEMNVISRVFLRDFYELLSDFTLYRMVVDGLAPLGTYHARTHELFFLHNIVAIRKGAATWKELV